MTDDLKAARDLLARFACSPESTIEEHDAITTVFAALDQAAEALKPFAVEAAEWDFVSDVDLRRAASVYATLKLADTKEGAG